MNLFTQKFEGNNLQHWLFKTNVSFVLFVTVDIQGFLPLYHILFNFFSL